MHDSSLPAGLYVVGTPIGNLSDISRRALDTLREVDIIYAEDTRRTRKLLAHYEISTRLASCHKFNEAARREHIIRAIADGGRLALVTDAGMPGVSDPGARVVRACREAHCPITVIPGPSAVSSAIALCGFGGRGFRFEGFLPPKRGARTRRLETLAHEDIPVVLFESPYRLLRLLEELETILGDREIFIGRELTKRFEECLTGPAATLREHFSGRTVRGELVIVLSSACRG